MYLLKKQSFKDWLNSNPHLLVPLHTLTHNQPNARSMVTTENNGCWEEPLKKRGVCGILSVSTLCISLCVCVISHLSWSSWVAPVVVADVHHHLFGPPVREALTEEVAQRVDLGVTPVNALIWTVTGSCCLAWYCSLWFIYPLSRWTWCHAVRVVFIPLV